MVLWLSPVRFLPSIRAALPLKWAAVRLSSGLAAVIIGEVIFGKLFHNFSLKLMACVFGAIIYYIVIQVVLRLGLDPNDLKLLTALIVAIFLAIPYWKSKIFRAKVQPVPEKEGNVHA